MSLNEEVRRIEKELGQMDIPVNKGAFAAIVAVFIAFLSWLVAPLAWVFGAVAFFCLVDAFIRSYKASKAKADPSGFFGFGSGNDRYVAMIVGAGFFFAVAYLNLHLFVGVISGVALYLWLTIEESLRSQGQRQRTRRSLFND